MVPKRAEGVRATHSTRVFYKKHNESINTGGLSNFFKKRAGFLKFLLEFGIWFTSLKCSFSICLNPFMIQSEIEV